MINDKDESFNYIYEQIDSMQKTMKGIENAFYLIDSYIEIFDKRITDLNKQLQEHIYGRYIP